jgi:hypothetical protein
MIIFSNKVEVQSTRDRTTLSLIWTKESKQKLGMFQRYVSWLEVFSFSKCGRKPYRDRADVSTLNMNVYL